MEPRERRPFAAQGYFGLESVVSKEEGPPHLQVAPSLRQRSHHHLPQQVLEVGRRGGLQEAVGCLVPGVGRPAGLQEALEVGCLVPGVGSRGGLQEAMAVGCRLHWTPV